jgi:hypothetical protein
LSLQTIKALASFLYYFLYFRDLKENGPPDGDNAPLLPHPGEAIDIPSIDGERFRCERDEYANLIDEMKRAGVVRTHRRGWLCCAKEVKVGTHFSVFCLYLLTNSVRNVQS